MFGEPQFIFYLLIGKLVLSRYQGQEVIPLPNLLPLTSTEISLDIKVKK
jgi:hypothetical protein